MSIDLILQQGVPEGALADSQGDVYKLIEQNNLEMVAFGQDASELAKVHAWYMSVPGLAHGVERLAWKHRKESPVIQVMGGVNARMTKTAVLLRQDWERVDEQAKQLGMANVGFAKRFAQSDFDVDKKYFVIIIAGAFTAEWNAPPPK